MIEEYLTKIEIEMKLKPFQKKLGPEYYILKLQIEKKEKEKRNLFYLRGNLNKD